MQQRFAPERKQTVDRVTGNQVIQWTNSSEKDQHLYYMTPSVTQDDRWLIFISERNIHPNLYGIVRPEGDIYQLTYNEKGLMRSYVYPQGGMDGLSKASPCLDSINNRLYWIEGNQVNHLELDTGSQAVLCNLPKHWYTAYNNLSRDGRFLCVPCTEQRAFPENIRDQWEQLHTVPKVMQYHKLITRLYRIDTNTGKMNIWAEVPFWVTHVQFDPLFNDRLIFNKEGEGSDATPRTWCLEANGSYRPLFEQGKYTTCSHEIWSPTGKFIIYQGWNQGLAFIEARTWEGKVIFHIPVPSFPAGHVTPNLDGRAFITDAIEGFITLITLTRQRYDGFTSSLMGLSCFLNRRRMRNLLPMVSDFFSKRVLVWRARRFFSMRHLCKHDTDSLQDQDAHAHAAFTPNGCSIIFTSNREGTCNVYEVLIGN